MEKINLYNIKKKYLMDLIQKSSDMMKELSMPNETEKCATLLKRLREDTFKVVIMGRFKVGKSTFINALLGNGDMLPAKATPCTAIINEVKYSKDERYAIIHFKHPIPTPMPKLAPKVKAYIEKFGGKPVNPIKIKPEDINQFVVINDEAEDQKEGTVQAPFEKAEIFWDLPLCEQGVEIIDTPGLEENIARTIVTKSYLTQADAIVFVLDCNALCSESEKESIKEDIQSAGHDYAIFVCNRINQIKDKDKEELKSRAYKMLQDKTQLGREGIVFIDAETAKDSKAANDMDKYAQTGMPEFEEQLSRVLVNKRGNIKLAQPAKQLESAIEYALATAIPNERQMLSTSTAEIQKRLQQEFPNLENLRRRKELLIIQLETEIKEIVRDTETLLQQRFNSISADMPKLVNGIICDNHVSWNPFKAKESVKKFTDELIEKLQKRLTSEQEDWQKIDLEPFIANKLQHLATKFQSKIAEIFVEIENIKLRIAGLSNGDNPNSFERISATVIGYLSGGIGGAVVGGALGFSKEFITILAAQIAVGVVLGTLIGLTNPFTIVMMLAVAFKGVKWATGKVEDKIRTKISEQVQTQLLEEKEECIRKAVDVIKQQLEKGKANVLEAIDNELLSVEKLVEQIKREKDAGEQNVKVKLTQLDRKATTFRGLLANLQSFITNMQKQDIDFEPLPMPDEVPSNENPSQDCLPPSSENLPFDSQSHDEQKNHTDDGEKLECSNPACVNYRKKVLPVDTKFCPECGSAIVKEAEKPVSTENEEKIACPNPVCKNHHQKVLSPNTKFCPECGTKIVVQQNTPQPQQPFNPTYVIDPKLDKFEKDGVEYYKVPNHKHGDNNCGGDIYIGDNATIVCGKCGETKRVIYWHPIHQTLDEDKYTMLTTTDRKILSDPNIAYNWVGLLPLGRKWLRRYTANLDDYFNDANFYNE